MKTPALLGLALPLVLAACASTPAPAGPPSPGARAVTEEEALETFDAAWTAIEEYHFDPQFNGVDWEALRAELRPEAAAAETRGEVRAVIRDMLARLDQSHFALIPAEALPAESAPLAEGEEPPEETPEEIAGGCGLDLRVRDGRLLVSSLEPEGPAARAGVGPGWVLTEIDGEAIGIPDEEQADPGADERRTDYFLRQTALGRTVGPIGSSVELSFLDGDDRETVVELERAERDVVAHSFGTALPTFYLHFESTTHEWDGRTIGRIHFTNWFLPMMRPIDEAIGEMRGLDGIVIDLRGNSGGAGAMTMGVAGHFYAEQTKIGSQTMREGTMNYVAFPRLVNAAGERVAPFAGPLAILVDETTGSASEVFAGGVQSTGRAQVLGETTAGAVLPARTTLLPGGDALLHAMGEFETSDGTLLEGRGVVPDEVVPLTREDLLAGRDRQLEAALSWIASRPRP